MASDLAYSLQSPATALIDYIADHTDYQADPTLLEVVLRLKQKWPSACDYVTRFRLPIPCQLSDPETKVRVEAYSILITDVSWIEIGGEFRYERTFDLARIVGLETDQHDSKTRISARAYIAQLLKNSAGVRVPSTLIKDLVKSGLADIDNLKLLEPEERRLFMTTNPGLVPAQDLLNELCKALLKGLRFESLKFGQLLFDKMAEPGQDLTLDTRKFNSITINGREVSCRALLLKHFSDVSVMRGLEARLG